jgi:prolyl-tRNA synthetase
MGSIVEVHHDESGILWPEAVAPFRVHLISLAKDEAERTKAEKIYQDLIGQGVEVLYDDRMEARAGEKFADSDLLGIPLRIVVSAKTLEKESVEVKRRGEKERGLVAIGEILKEINRNKK